MLVLTTQKAEAPRTASHRAGPILGFWVALVLGIQTVAWLSGMRGYGLAEAVEQGTARVETRSIGELPDDVIRKAIRTQQDTLVFWATLAAIGDFAGESVSLILRALLTATLLAGLAALTGRPLQFEAGLADAARAQGFWVLGLAVHAGLMIALGRPEVETSATLLLAPGTYPATLWVALRQLDVFALIGWSFMAHSGWRRGQTTLPAAFAACLALWSLEALVRVSLSLSLGAGMRLTIMPD